MKYMTSKGRRATVLQYYSSCTSIEQLQSVRLSVRNCFTQNGTNDGKRPIFLFLVGWWVGWLVGELVGWEFGWLSVWLFGYLVGCLFVCLFVWLVGLCLCLFACLSVSLLACSVLFMFVIERKSIVQWHSDTYPHY